jgi:hypothetical protein
MLPSAINKRVLMGEKLHNALYPKNDTLLADPSGIMVTTAKTMYRAANMMCTGTLLLFIRASCYWIKFRSLGISSLRHLAVFNDKASYSTRDDDYFRNLIHN